MAVSFAPIGNGYNFLNGIGSLPNSGGKINTYAAGTNTPQATFTTNTGAVQNANPIILDAAGRPTNGGNPVEIWLTNGLAYKFVLTDSLNNVIATYDNLVGINDVGGTTLTGPITVSGNLTVTGNETVNGAFTASSTGSFGDTVSFTSNTSPTLASGYGAVMAIAANMIGSNHRVFFGDGSGSWVLFLSSRNASVTNDRFSFRDNGNFAAQGNIGAGNGVTVTAGGITVVTGGVTTNGTGGVVINGGNNLTIADGGQINSSGTYTGQLLYSFGGGDNTNFIFNNNSRGLDAKQWGFFYASDASLRMRLRKDDASAPVDVITMSRTGAALTGIQLACMNVPANQQNGNYTFVITDAGKPVTKNTNAVTATWTVPPNSSVAFPLGTMIPVANHDLSGNNVTLAQGAGVSLFLPGTALAGNRTLSGVHGFGYLLKFDTDSWIVGNLGGVT